MQQMKFSPTSRLVYFVLTVLCVWGLMVASFGWSRGETMEFCTYIFGENYSPAVSIFIQFSPNIFFLIAGSFALPPKLRFLLRLLGMLFNCMDWYTNHIAFTMSLNAGLLDSVPADLRGAVSYFGYLSAFLVTWAEEPLALLLGFNVFLLGEILNDFFGFEMPEWASKDIVDLLEKASGMEEVGAKMRGSSTSTQNNGNQRQEYRNDNQQNGFNGQHNNRQQHGQPNNQQRQDTREQWRKNKHYEG